MDAKSIRNMLSILVVVNKHNTARVASCWFIIYYRQEHVLAYHGDITRWLKITAAGYEKKIQTEWNKDLVLKHDAVTLFNLQILLRELNYFSFTY
jgi:hypothetical protein